MIDHWRFFFNTTCQDLKGLNVIVPLKLSEKTFSLKPYPNKVFLRNLVSTKKFKQNTMILNPILF